MAAIWQNVVVLGLVAGALAYVAWRIWRVGASKSPPGCPMCHQCIQWWKEGGRRNEE